MAKHQFEYCRRKIMKGPTNIGPWPKRPRVTTPISTSQRRSASSPTPTPAPDPIPTPAPAPARRPCSEGCGEMETPLEGSERELEEDEIENGGCGNESVGSCSRGLLSATITDLEVLDCPICYNPLSAPVYQCYNGHISCDSCCTFMDYKCASCGLQIGKSNRCRAIEQLIESVIIPCPNTPYGCKETIIYNKQLAHGKTCNYTPCTCPHSNCGYVGMSKGLYTHFSQIHPHASRSLDFNNVVSISLDKNQMQVFFQHRIHSTLFVLNRSIKPIGNFVNIVCVAPDSANGAFLYDLTAIEGEMSVRIKNSVECVQKWTARALTRRSLVVPKDFISISGRLKMELIIWKNPSFAT